MTILIYNEINKGYINHSFWSKYTLSNLIILETELKVFIRSIDEQKTDRFNDIADVNDRKVWK